MRARIGQPRRVDEPEPVGNPRDDAQGLPRDAGGAWPQLHLPRDASAKVIGRDPDCDLVLIDPRVSRRHAALQPWPTGWEVSDLGSTNGTRVNGWRVTSPVQVKPGDIVAFGPLVFQVAVS